MKADGGPAFPHHVEYNALDAAGAFPLNGMSLRDYFAASATWDDVKAFRPQDSAVHTEIENVVRARYAYADAMLLEREKGTK